jgi:hypothetical protein
MVTWLVLVVVVEWWVLSLMGLFGDLIFWSGLRFVV